MVPFNDTIIVDPAQLRMAAATLRRAASEVADLGMRLPREAWGAPTWLIGSADEELGLARRGIDELVDEVRAEASRLEARANEVDGAERRWSEIANGELRCGCILPTGAIVTTAVAGGAISAASGAGTAVASGQAPTASNGITYLSADGRVLDPASIAGTGVSVIGGQGLGPGVGAASGITYLSADGRVLDPASFAGTGVSTIGGQGLGLGVIGGTTISVIGGQGLGPGVIGGGGWTFSPVGGPGLETPMDAAFAATDAAERAKWAKLIAGGGGPAGPVYISPNAIAGATAHPQLPTSIPGDGKMIYGTPMGGAISAYPTDYGSHSIGATPTNALAIG